MAFWTYFVAGMRIGRSRQLAYHTHEEDFVEYVCDIQSFPKASFVDETFFCLAVNSCRDVSPGLTWNVQSKKNFLNLCLSTWSSHRISDHLFVNFLKSSLMAPSARRSTEAEITCTCTWCTFDRMESRFLPQSASSYYR